MSQRIYLYPASIRVWHMLNAILIILLIISGISLQYSNPNYPLIRFDIAVGLHNYSGVFLSFSYLIFFIGNFVTGNFKHYSIKLRGWGTRLWKQFHYYALGMFKNAEPPFPITKTNKFNPLQRVSYSFIMYIFVPIVIITGWGLLYPEILFRKVFGIGGHLFTDILHVITGFIISCFLFVHIYFCTIGKNPLKNFKSIITGFHEH